MSQQKLLEKVYGKQKVYMADQSLFPEVPQAELKEMEKKITELQERLKGEITQCREMESRMFICILSGASLFSVSVQDCILVCLLRVCTRSVYYWWSKRSHSQVINN